MAYNTDLPVDNTADIRENFRALKEDKIVAADTANTADVATKLATARTIALTGDATGSAKFDGSGDATITVDVTSADTAALCTGNAATATKLETAVNINGVAFDGTKDITITATADGGNADTVDGKHAADFAPAGYMPPNATTTADGSMSAVDKVKLDGIEAGAQVNQNAFSNVLANGTTIHADSQTDTIELVQGTNIALTADATNEKVTIAVTGKVASAAAADTSAVCTGNAATATTASACSGNSVTATKLATTRTISLTGDGTASVSFDGSASASGALTLAASGVTAGTYLSTTVDAKGRVTAGTNPTSLDVSITGNAATATTAGTCTGNAATATYATSAGSAPWSGVTGAPTMGNAVSVLTGTIAHGGTIPLPDGYTQNQCKWFVSLNHLDYRVDLGTGSGDFNAITCMVNANRVVTVVQACYSVTGTANYIIIGVK